MSEQTKLVNWIHSRRGIVTVRDLMRGPLSSLTADEVETTLQKLVDSEVGTWETLPATIPGGRATRAFRLSMSAPPADPQEGETSEVAEISTDSSTEVAPDQVSPTVEEPELITSSTEKQPAAPAAAILDAQQEPVASQAIEPQAEPKPQVSRAQILEGLGRLEAAVALWRETVITEKRKPWITHHRFPLSREIEAAASSLVELCDTTAVERDAWPLALAVDAFVHEVAMLVERIGNLEVDPEAGDIWTQFNAMIQAKSPRPRTNVPTPRMLASQGLSNREIARQMRWITGGGVPDEVKVREELAEPGRHFRQEDYTHARDRAYWSDIERRWESRSKAIEGRKPAVPAKPKRERQPARETLDELLQQHVNPRQITKMKNISLDEVYARANVLGLDVGETKVHGTFRDAQRVRQERERARLQRALKLQSLNTYYELGDDQAERIRRMLADGVAMLDVRDSLQHYFPSITLDVVAGIAASLESASTSTEPVPANAQ